MYMFLKQLVKTLLSIVRCFFCKIFRNKRSKVCAKNSFLYTFDSLRSLSMTGIEKICSHTVTLPARRSLGEVGSEDEIRAEWVQQILENTKSLRKISCRMDKQLTKIIFSILFFCLPIASQSTDNNITVLGIGRLGICTALCMEQAGYNVLGVDVSQSYIDQINSKKFITNEPKVSSYLQASKNFRATTSLDEGLNFSDIYFIVVATPSTPHEEAYDHSMLSKLLFEINKRQVKNKHVIICCTVFPGYIANVAKYLLKDCPNITVSYNPEFIAQGNIIYGFENPDMVLIGEGSKQIGNILENIYARVCKNKPNICRMSPSSAEITKLSINCFVTTKIAFANMIGDAADLTPGADKNDILNAVGKDTRVGSKYLKPGYGFGGPCFPRDNRALGSYIKKIGLEPIINEATDNANKLHAKFMAERLLAQNLNIYIFEDVNYKDNCNVIILEESQKLAVASILAKYKKNVVIRDKKNVILEVQQKFGNLFKYEIL